MSIAKCAAHLAAAAVAVGLSLAVPHGVASADDAAAGSPEPAVTESAAPAPPKSSVSRRSVHGADATIRVASGQHESASTGRPAAARAVAAPTVGRPKAKSARTPAAPSDTTSLAAPTTDNRVPTPGGSAVPDQSDISPAAAAPSNSTSPLNSMTVTATETAPAPTVFHRAPRAAATVGATFVVAGH